MSLQTVVQNRGALVGPTLMSAFKDGGRIDELTLTGMNHGKDDMGVTLRARLSASLKPVDAVFTLRASIPDARDGGGGHSPGEASRFRKAGPMACSVDDTATRPDQGHILAVRPGHDRMEANEAQNKESSSFTER
ncbi:hypothetical protein [Agrobacterium sp. CNPSo 2736]|uniref:hypothetical protein n=1 Tax=Agrobacterium sp. CNPSo 2736 TaxID=2499627 RepID=UPI0013E2AE39|nr:hypothetical protein [Agrobacterium sp. CNPSo 2736]